MKQLNHLSSTCAPKFGRRMSGRAESSRCKQFCAHYINYIAATVLQGPAVTKMGPLQEFIKGAFRACNATELCLSK